MMVSSADSTATNTTTNTTASSTPSSTAYDLENNGTENSTTNTLYNTTYNTIVWGDRFNYPNNFKGYRISFEDLDSYDFSKGFNEFIKKQDYVHLYFDFDEIRDEETYIEAIKWLDSLKEVFGKYSIGGYSNDNEFSTKYGYKHIPDNKHYVSLHVIFYESMISTEELIEIMRHTKKNGFKDYMIPDYVDYNVYKLSSRQVFRHVLSDKRVNENDVVRNAGNLLNNEKPSNHIIQVRGNERIVNKAEWLRVIPKRVSKTEQRKITTQNNKVEKQVIKEKKELSKYSIEDIDYEDKLIIFNDDEIQEFLNNFAPEFDNLMSTLAPLRYSPYDKEFLRNHLLQWYSKREHTNGEENTVDKIMNYYKKDKSNKWFFSLLKHLDDSTKDYYLNKYVDNINYSVNINNGKLCIDDVFERTYSVKRFAKLLNDLRSCVGFVQDRWYLKTYSDEKQMFIAELSEEKLIKKLKSYKLIQGCPKLLLSSIILKYSMVFRYKDARIVKQCDEDTINLFQGFKYNEVFTDDFTILEPLLKHTKEVICNGNEAKYEYMIKWFANIFQNITVKNGTLPIIHGSQGSGKSFIAELFCELLGVYALANVDDLDKVFGKFNGLIGRNLLICINEPPEATERFKYLGKIKSKLTQKKTVQEMKGIDQIQIDSWANYIMTTNNPSPVQEEKGDRRLIYYETNNKYCGNELYFNELCKDIQPIKQGSYNREFMGILLHYMRTQIDVSNWNTESLIREINANTHVDYNEQLERQYLDLNAVDRYVVDNYECFINGVILDDISIEGYKSTGLARKLNSICIVKRVRVNGIRVSKYYLKPREQINDIYNIIDYRNYEVKDNGVDYSGVDDV